MENIVAIFWKDETKHLEVLLTDESINTVSDQLFNAKDSDKIDFIIWMDKSKLNKLSALKSSGPGNITMENLTDIISEKYYHVQIFEIIENLIRFNYITQQVGYKLMEEFYSNFTEWDNIFGVLNDDSEMLRDNEKELKPILKNQFSKTAIFWFATYMVIDGVRLHEVLLYLNPENVDKLINRIDKVFWDSALEKSKVLNKFSEKVGFSTFSIIDDIIMMADIPMSEETEVIKKIIAQLEPYVIGRKITPQELKDLVQEIVDTESY